ncbi:MAG: hypothetical protein ACI9EW_003397 [Cellvibrionaceae bacterium]|jgi:hypothetical protein
MTLEAFLANGRFFTPSEVLAPADVCVLRHKTAEDLFEGDEPLDELIWVNRRKCLVIGVLTELETINPAQRNQLRPNEALYLPISTAIQNLFDEEPSVQIIARVSDEAQMGLARQHVSKSSAICVCDMKCNRMSWATSKMILTSQLAKKF